MRPPAGSRRLGKQEIPPWNTISHRGKMVSNHIKWFHTVGTNLPLFPLLPTIDLILFSSPYPHFPKSRVRRRSFPLVATSSQGIAARTRQKVVPRSRHKVLQGLRSAGTDDCVPRRSGVYIHLSVYIHLI